VRVAAIVTISVGTALAAAPAIAGPGGRATTPCRAGVLRSVGTPAAAFAAVARRETDTYRRPNGERLATFQPVTHLGYPTTFSIVGAIVRADCSAAWYRVKLPIRPNGTTGYLRPADVSVQEVATRIAVDLSRRELSLYRSGNLVLRLSVAVGSATTPTPIGRYYVDQRIRTTDPAGPFGPAVLAVSAHSNVLTDWAEGGPIAIHGTDAPWTIGRASTHGCIRVRNETLARLFPAIAGGTPVVIHP
jgi:lipoprotein-anchoring transpeptidase ErfK/SrfK